jgi:hypothetical protein
MAWLVIGLELNPITGNYWGLGFGIPTGGNARGDFGRAGSVGGVEFSVHKKNAIPS